MAIHNETLINRAIWMRGFLESLEYSDNISKEQIQRLKSKLDELITDISEKFDNELPFEEHDSPYKEGHITKDSQSSYPKLKKNSADDLPF